MQKATTKAKKIKENKGKYSQKIEEYSFHRITKKLLLMSVYFIKGLSSSEYNKVLRVKGLFHESPLKTI